MIRVNGRARAPQYWKMDRQIYARGEPPFYTKLTPEFCFGHWSTQCRSAFQVPRAVVLTLILHPPTAHPRCCRLQLRRRQAHAQPRQDPGPGRRGHHATCRTLSML